MQQSLPSVLDTISTATKAAKSHFQNIVGINIADGNSDIGFNQLQADKGSSVNQNRTEATLQNANVQSALQLLSTLKQDVIAINFFNSIKKKTLEVPIKTIEEELKKPKSDKNCFTQ
ncbi:hypothetical protein [uncultured Nostoc sp.]|uniref:hypothetical protein n=1 Tax=uncultured Nostoc sp. TaxID=340711 RepID=UPI0035CA6744